MGPLKRQEETARQYLKLKEQLKACEVNLFLQEYAGLRENLAGLQEKLAIVKGDFNETSENYETIKAEYDRLEQKLNPTIQRPRLCAAA